MTGIGQLALSVQLPDDETFTSYQRLTGINKDEQNQVLDTSETLRRFVLSFSEGNNKQNSFYLFGISGVGKSHLLHATCSYAAELGVTSQCLSLSELSIYPSTMLVGLEAIDLICIDDIHLIAKNVEWERGIFDLFNRLMENGKCVVISGNESVNELGILLPDLISRLSWGDTEQVKPLTDDEKIHALKYRAQQRGLLLSDDAARFLVNHLSREMKDLILSLDLLDKASIKEQRKLTIPFIKEILLNSE